MSVSNAVLYCGLNEMTFRVDDVVPGDERFATTSVWTRAEKLTGRSLRAASHAPNFLIVEDEGHHALLSAVHLAFSRHLPLALTPDAIWLTIAQGFSLHVNNHPEELRSLLVNHAGKMQIKATVSSLEDPADWAYAAEQWAQEIGSHTSANLQDTLVCDFSTTTPTIRTASQIVLMETFRPYFDYILECICGIPQITLHGTVEDWRSIRARVERLAQYQLAWWADRLLPLCDAFIATAAGQPSREFWQAIYKPKQEYGRETIIGWITDLFPYVLDAKDAPKARNPLLAKARAELTLEDGLPAERFPRGISIAPVTLTIGAPIHKKIALEFLGGFLGVTQRSQDGCVQPELGWGVQEQNAFVALLEALPREHTLFPHVRPVRFKWLDYMPEMPGEMFQMWDHFDGGVLFADTEHPWKLRSSCDYTSHDNDVAGADQCICFLDLVDGRSIGFLLVGWREKSENGWDRCKQEWWIVVGRPEPGVDGNYSRPGEILRSEKMVLIAKSLSQLFERIQQAGGRYYFDSPDFTPDAPSASGS